MDGDGGGFDLSSMFGGGGDSGGGLGGLLTDLGGGTGSGGGQDAGGILSPGTNVGGGGGGFDFMKLLPSLIPAATGLLGMFTGQGAATDKALKAQGKSTAPMGAFGQRALQQYESGQLSPSGEAALDQYRKSAKAKYEQMAASMGIPVSTMDADINNKVEMDTMAFKNQLLQQEFQNAFGATGMATSNLTNLARQQALEDAQQRKSWEDFMAQLGKLGGGIFAPGGGIMNLGGGGDTSTPTGEYVA